MAANVSRKERLRTVQRRIDYLDERIEARGGEGEKHAGYDVAERNALRWMHGIVSALVEEDDPRTRRPRRIHSMWEPDAEEVSVSGSG